MVGKMHLVQGVYAFGVGEDIVMTAGQPCRQLQCGNGGERETPKTRHRNKDAHFAVLKGDGFWQSWRVVPLNQILRQLYVALSYRSHVLHGPSCPIPSLHSSQFPLLLLNWPKTEMGARSMVPPPSFSLPSPHFSFAFTASVFSLLPFIFCLYSLVLLLCTYGHACKTEQENKGVNTPKDLSITPLLATYTFLRSAERERVRLRELVNLTHRDELNSGAGKRKQGEGRGEREGGKGGRRGGIRWASSCRLANFPSNGDRRIKIKLKVCCATWGSSLCRLLSQSTPLSISEKEQHSKKPAIKLYGMHDWNWVDASLLKCWSKRKKKTTTTSMYFFPCTHSCHWLGYHSCITPSLSSLALPHLLLFRSVVQSTPSTAQSFYHSILHPVTGTSAVIPTVPPRMLKNIANVEIKTTRNLWYLDPFPHGYARVQREACID